MSISRAAGFVPRRLLGLLLAAVLVLPALVFSSGPGTAAAAGICNPKVGREYRSKTIEFFHADVWMYGDSITYQTHAWLKLPRLAVDAYSGRKMSEAADLVVKDLRTIKHRPKVLLMAVGSNDRRKAEQFTYHLRRLLGAVPQGIRIVWVNTYAEISAGGPEINRILASRPRIEIVDWAKANREAQVKRHSPYVSDGVHTTRLGCEVRNSLIRKKVQQKPKKGRR